MLKIDRLFISSVSSSIKKCWKAAQGADKTKKMMLIKMCKNEKFWTAEELNVLTLRFWTFVFSSTHRQGLKSLGFFGEFESLLSVRGVYVARYVADCNADGGIFNNELLNLADRA